MTDFGTTATGFGGGFSPLMTALIVIFAVLLLGVIGRGLFVWMRNNNSPRQTVGARVVAKRMKVTGHGHTMTGRTSSMNMVGSSVDTRYFVTFELETGNRLELGVKDSEYGLLIEGDQGQLTFQGTRYLGFEQSIRGTNR